MARPEKQNTMVTEEQTIYKEDNKKKLKSGAREQLNLYLEHLRNIYAQMSNIILSLFYIFVD